MLILRLYDYPLPDKNPPVSKIHEFRHPNWFAEILVRHSVIQGQGRLKVIVSDRDIINAVEKSLSVNRVIMRLSYSS